MIKSNEEIRKAFDEKFKTITNKIYADTPLGQMEITNDIKSFFLTQRAEDMEEVRKEIEKMETKYPISVFSEPPAGWEKKLDEWAKMQGFRIDNISAHFARWQEKIVKDDTLSLLDTIIKPKEK